jgi:hypothetical protein
MCKDQKYFGVVHGDSSSSYLILRERIDKRIFLPKKILILWWKKTCIEKQVTEDQEIAQRCNLVKTMQLGQMYNWIYS